MKTPPLDRQTEALLLREAREGDEQARMRIVGSNMRLVVNIAKTFRRSPIAVEDLVMDGTIGLMQAIERFDADSGFRFSTYATFWVRSAISRAVERPQKS